MRRMYRIHNFAKYFCTVFYIWQKYLFVEFRQKCSGEYAAKRGMNFGQNEVIRLMFLLSP